MTKVEKINSRIIAALEANGIERYRVAGEVRRLKIEKAIVLMDYISPQNWNPFVFEDKYDITVFHLPISGNYDLSKDLNSYESRAMKNIVIVSARDERMIAVIENELQRLISHDIFIGKVERDELTVWDRLWFKELPHPRDFRVVAYEYEFNEQVSTNICQPIITTSCEMC